jgi:hypothetical protein
VRKAHLHSGDILVSRGGAPTSALIARGNDYPGNFSHIAFVYVDPGTHISSIVEAHIERGVVVSTVEQYLTDKKLRVMLLRLRSDLPQLTKDPMSPHKAAEQAYTRATTEHVPYDFEMNYKDHRKLFCSEVASAAYEPLRHHPLDRPFIFRHRPATVASAPSASNTSRPRNRRTSKMTPSSLSWPNGATRKH